MDLDSPSLLPLDRLSLPSYPPLPQTRSLVCLPCPDPSRTPLDPPGRPLLDTGGDRGSAWTADLRPPSSLHRYRRRWWLSNRAGHILRQAGARCSITGCGHGIQGQQTVFRLEPGTPGDDVPRIAVDGVRWCGSARCPRCGPLVASKVSERIAALLAAARDRGVGVAFLTLTLAHDPMSRMIDLRDVTRDAFKSLQHGRPWKALKAAGLLGLVRVWEVTGGPGGWHLHAHVLAFHSGGTDAAVAAGRELTGTWTRLVRARGYRAVAEAQDCRPVLDGEPLGDYGAKSLRGWDVAAELASAWVKGGRRPYRMSLPQILALAAEGDSWARSAYVEAVVALKGQKVLIVSPPLKAALGVISEDVSDEDAVEPEAQLGEVLGEMPAATWSRACTLSLSAWVLGEIDRLVVRQGVAWPDLLWHVRARVWRDPPDG